MRRIVWGAGVALLLGGCATVEMAPYAVTSFAEVPLKEKARVKVVANNDSLRPIAAAISAEFAKNGAFTIADEDAEYWFILNGAGEYRADRPTTKACVAAREDEAGGYQEVVAEAVNLASAAREVGVAVYKVKGLSPVHYFEIPIYDGDNTGGAVRGEATYSAEFARDVVERVKDAFLTQKKTIKTPVPLEADAKLRSLFAKGDYLGFLKSYKALGLINLSKTCEEIRAKTYEGDADAVLSNYYLYLLVSESLAKDPDKLREIRADHLAILAATDADGLVDAVPVALARIDYKLANM